MTAPTGTSRSRGMRTLRMVAACSTNAPFSITEFEIRARKPMKVKSPTREFTSSA
jgi:hypothetical protein